jgi:hypothetical protein
MSSPLPYLVRMLLFLVAVAALAFWLHEDLIRIFEHTPQLDAVILVVLLAGIFFVFRQVIILWPEVSWMRRYQHRDVEAPVPPRESINLLAPLAAMVGESHDQIRLSPTATRAVLDGIATRLDERREITRYMIGLLIFLGLLGTFWGLLQTIGSVADAINGLQVSAGDPVQMFARLKSSIEGPLKGMSTAFGASLFGLSGSLVLGFLELQASQAQGRFHIELEEWLAHATSLSSSPLPPGVAQSVPAYVEALLERNTEGVDGLIRAVHRIEESRQSAQAGNATLVERLAALAETMRAQQNLLARFTELSIELRAAVARLSERSAADDAEREASQAHRRAVEGHLGRLVEESLRTRGALATEIAKASDAQRESLETRIVELGKQVAGQRQQLSTDVGNVLAQAQERGTAFDQHRRVVEERLERLGEDTVRSRAQMSEDLNRALARFSDRSAAEADREAMANLQQTVEGQLTNVVDENARSRTALAEELRRAVNQLTERFGDVDRETMATHRRNIEAHLARLVEDTASNHTELADEIRGEIRLLARTIALSRAAASEQEQTSDG